MGVRAASTAEAVQQFVDGVTKYGTRRTVTLIPGEGTGPELAQSVKTVFTFATRNINRSRPAKLARRRIIFKNISY